MSQEKRTSLRITTARQNKLSELRKQFGFSSNDETIGFLIDIADGEKMIPHAKRHLARLKVQEQKDKQKKQQVEKLLSNLSEDQIAELLANGVG